MQGGRDTVISFLYVYSIACHARRQVRVEVEEGYIPVLRDKGEIPESTLKKFFRD
jgi:hypothetical protein